MPKTKYNLGPIMGGNVLKKEYEDPGDLPWEERVIKIGLLVREANATVFMAQECGPDEAISLAAELGSEWRYTNYGINTVLWDSDFWVYKFREGYDLPGPQNRTLIMVKLEDRESQEYMWFGSTHLAVKTANRSEENAKAGRTLQAIYLRGILSGYRQYVFSADINDSLGYSIEGGVRNILLKGNPYMREIRPPQTKNRIDTMFAGPRASLDKVKIVSTNRASDHNFTKGEVSSVR